MKKTKRTRNGKMTEKEIEMFCMRVEETLKKIHDRCGLKEGKKKKKAKRSTQNDFSTLNKLEETDSMHLVG